MTGSPTAHDEDIGMLKAIAKEHGRQITKLFEYHDQDIERQRDTDEKLNRAATLLEGVSKVAHDPSSCPGVQECRSDIQQAKGGSAIVKWVFGGGLAAAGYVAAKLLDAFGK